MHRRNCAIKIGLCSDLLRWMSWFIAVASLFLHIDETVGRLHAFPHRIFVRGNPTSMTFAACVSVHFVRPLAWQQWPTYSVTLAALRKRHSVGWAWHFTQCRFFHRSPIDRWLFYNVVIASRFLLDTHHDRCLSNMYQTLRVTIVFHHCLCSRRLNVLQSTLLC